MSKNPFTSNSTSNLFVYLWKRHSSDRYPFIQYKTHDTIERGLDHFGDLIVEYMIVDFFVNLHSFSVKGGLVYFLMRFSENKDPIEVDSEENM